jgi:hypothetical protein
MPRVRPQTPVTTASSDLGAATVLDLDGREHALDSLWRDQPIVLAFVRHFG